MAWILFLLSLAGAWLAWNVLRPSYSPARRAVVSFLLGWLVGELGLHHAILWTVMALVLAANGALESFVGQLGFLITIGTVFALVYAWRLSFEASPAVERGLCEGLGPDYRKEILPEVSARHRSDIDWWRVALPFFYRHPDVARVRDIRYRRIRGVNLHLDVWHHRSRPKNAPVLFEIHGGGWIVGSKNEQGIPMMVRMASQGWVCVSANYRLSPHATWPDHLVDLKYALKWIKDNVAEYGGDPEFIVVVGQSAGGHLASMVALTADEPSLQPGLEGVDLSVEGCISFYGVYDFTDRRGIYRNEGLKEVLEEKVMKASLEEDRAAYEQASPLTHIDPDTPPFLVIHSDCDTLVPVDEARRFVEDLRAVTKNAIVYIEIKGAQHAWEIFHSVRSELTLSGIERFLGWLHSKHLAKRAPEPATETPQAAAG